MTRALVFALLIFPSLGWSISPEVLECTVTLTMREDSETQVRAIKDSNKNLKIVDSGKTSDNRWIFLVRFLGASISDFSSSLKFETVETYPAEFHLSAQSGRKLGDLQLFNLLWESADSGSWIFQTAKAELVAQTATNELNSYASLQGELAFQVAPVTKYEINCGPVGWYFGGLVHP